MRDSRKRIAVTGFARGQIEFTEWTPDGHLRHSRFVGLREDKAAKDVMREIEG
jgi:ATP-dependent DNA ligase